MSKANLIRGSRLTAAQEYSNRADEFRAALLDRLEDIGSGREITNQYSRLFLQRDSVNLERKTTLADLPQIK
jgi:hypothetical protein